MRHVLALVLTPLLLATLVVASPLPAHAGSTARKDPADTESRLDLKRISLKTVKRAGATRVVGSIATHERFSKDDLDNANSLRVTFKTGPNRYRGAHVLYIGDDLVATLCTYDSPTQTGGDDCSTHPVKRTSATSVRFVVPRAAISRKKVLRWRGHAMAWTRSAGCTTAPMCNDFLGAGDAGRGFLRWRA